MIPGARGGRGTKVVAIMLAAALVLGGGALLFAAIGGSGDPYARYCDEVTDQQQALSEAVGLGPGAGLLAALPSFRDLADAAPSDLVDEWRVVLTRSEALADAVDAAGLDPATYDPSDNLPDDLDPDAVAMLTAAEAGLAGPQAAAALVGVQQQARDVCGTPLVVDGALDLVTGAGATRESESGPYCEEVRARQAALSRVLSSGGADALLRALPAFRALAAQSPGTLLSDWRLVVRRVAALRDALTAAGVEPSDWATYDPQDPPAGISAAQRAAVEQAATDLASATTEEALGVVQTVTTRVCGTSLVG
ncbi:MAG: hypothetical protein CMH83_22110 [Nocardioides sp.]|nr:hypothetical protein [Nocardioides sp.]